MTTESQKLLSAYVKSGSEDAFRELLRQYVDLVYSTALRVAHGDEHLAQDVTQTVFLNLARKAATIPDSMPLGGWLHRDAFFTASKMVRAEIRRESRERKAVEMNLLHASEQSTIETSLHLDAAINQLPDHDRQAILLRFFEQRDFESIGQALGSSANAAQKRVSRAVDQLRRILSGRGVIVSEVALLATLGQAVSAAPPALAGTVGVAVLSAIKTPTLNLLAILMGNKIFTAVTGIVIAGSLFAPLLLQTHLNAIIQYQQSAQGKLLVRLFDMKGRLLKEQEANMQSGYGTHTISDLSPLPKGTYLLELWVDGKRKVEKVLKQ